MPLRIPQTLDENKFSHRLSLPLLEQIYPRSVICDLLSQLGLWERRERKLSQLVMVYLLLCWHLYLQESLRSVFLHLSASLRLLGLMSMQQVPTKNAFLRRRKQLGVRLFRALLQQVCQPQASPQTPGAFAFGYRLTAIDGTLEDVADTVANARFFGRIATGQTASPYPQARCLYLEEVGTHLIFDAIIAPCQASEQSLCWGLLRSICGGMLVLLDRGFVCGPFFQAIRERQAQVLARLPRGIFLRRERVLPDGSYLTTLTPQMCRGLKKPMQVRIVEFFLEEQVAEALSKQPPSRTHSKSNGTNPDVKQRHRLITTLLDPDLAPALQLCLLYHERWEIELSIDEVKNHLRLSQHPLRSHLPLLALQEAYAMLLTHYALRVIMLRATQTQASLDPDRLSLTLTVQGVRDAMLLAAQKPPEVVRIIMDNLFASLVAPDSLVEPRRLRFNCRVVKRINTRFRRKRPEHHNLHLKNTSFADILLM
jgi:transposase IS4-like protein/DDE family transposase